MSLIEIKNYMMVAKFASINNLCRIFNSEPEMMRCLLSHWIRKGKIRRCDVAACKTPCASACAALVNEHYEWICVG